MDLLKYAASYFKILCKRWTPFFTDEIPVLYIELLKKCNLKCVYCNYSRYNDNDDEVKLSYDDFKNNIIPSARKLNTKIISLSGGEPLMHPELFSIIKLITDNDIIIHLNTNGSLIDKDIINKFYEYRIKNINISLDSINAEVNNKIRSGIDTEKLLEGIENLIKRIPDINLSLNCTLSLKNLDSVNDIIIFMKKCKINNINFNLISSSNQFKNNKIEKLSFFNDEQKKIFFNKIFELKNTLKHEKIHSNIHETIKFGTYYLNSLHIPISCFAGYALINIDPYGNVFPCYNLKSHYNIRNNDLYSIASSLEFKKHLKNVGKCRRISYCCGSQEISYLFNLHHIIFDLKFIISKIDFVLKFKR